MSKYEPLWQYILKENKEKLVLSYVDLEKILTFPFDHSFLTNKKELLTYGFEVEKISMKNQTITFKKRSNS